MLESNAFRVVLLEPNFASSLAKTLRWSLSPPSRWCPR